MDKFAFLGNLDNSAVEELFEKFRADPSSVDESWRMFFEGFEFCRKNFKAEKGDAFIVPNEFKVINLINGYRQRGHLFTRTNPVRVRRKYLPTLDLENFGLTKEELTKTFQAGKEIGLGNAKLSEIISHLQQTYCQSVGIEFTYIRQPEIVEWLRNKMENSRNTPDYSIDQKEKILKKLGEAVLLEKFIHKKFPGHKSFSLEGVESLIPAINAVVNKGAALGIEELVIGMAHRGRLNVLGNIMHKPFRQIFSEFEAKEYKDDDLLGDVKYHLGFTKSIQLQDGKTINITLSPNPSHLEAVGPVAEGIVRARIDNYYNGDNGKIIPVLVHGDASIAGQGVVYEVIQMSTLEGYKTGGTIHLIVNNQLGFTTNYIDGRSSTYCTDVGKTIQSPVFHVNADDVEAVVYTVELAMEFRQKFHRDVFIDLLGYRKYGHNESDEPRFTQPVLYKIIEQHPDPLEIYLKKLESEGTLPGIDFESIKNTINDWLAKSYDESRKIEKADIAPFMGSIWKDYKKAVREDFTSSPDTSVSKNVLFEVGKVITSLPPEVKFFRKITRLQEERRIMLEKTGLLDWAMGELLAYGTLLKEGYPVRLGGQDTQRGTFSHRHAVLTIEHSEDKYIPLAHVNEQVPFYIYNSLLSEYGVLGFDYGYALASPATLTIWEAQFGDFSNGGQIIIDQYLSSAEEKWKVMNGLVLFLPHGYEGQGPEHSSARMERFLSLCGHYNFQVVNCSTPANLFHVLRRQIHRNFRKPLVIFTPKSLLRHPRCVSSVNEFTQGGFKEVIDDLSADPGKAERVVFCSGKVYYDILEEKEKQGKADVALVRIEQLYPFPQDQVRQIIAKYSRADSLHWIQEEPVNMGAWKFISQNSGITLYHTARPASGSPATGSGKLHKIQQELIITKALGKCTCDKANGACRLECGDDDGI